MKAKSGRTAADRVFMGFIYVFIFLCTAAALYPMIYTLSMSISGPEHIAVNDIYLLPKGFSTDAYKLVFADREIWSAYYNTLWYTVVGTVLSVVLTVVGAYPLSRKRFFMRRGMMRFIIITMYFSGGLIRSFCS